MSEQQKQDMAETENGQPQKPELKQESPVSDGSMYDETIRAAQIACDSYTMRRQDSRWVASEAARRCSEPVYIVSESLHRALRARVGYYPSAREVGAICRAVFAALCIPEGGAA